MEENTMTMADLMAEVDQSMKRIYTGDIKKAKIISVEDEAIIVHIGYHTDAIIPWNEYSYDAVKKEDVQIGDTFDVLILKIDDGEGNVLVSKKRAEAEVALENIGEMLKKQETFTVKIKEVVKGGVITSVQGVRAFIPGSQITDSYVTDLNDFVGQSIEVEIIEFDPKKRKLVLSGKAIAKAKTEELKKQKFETLVEGEKYTGIITKLMPYGAFVRIEGVEGLVHNTDLSWVRIKHPSDVVKEGDEVQVTILNIDKEKGKISLGMKDVAMDPWYLETVNIEKDQVLAGKVVKFMSFGAFVSLTEHVEGLVHISQIADKRISKPEEALELGQEVKVKVISIDKENKKIGLSITQAIEVIEEDMNEYMVQEEENFGDAGDAFKGIFK